MKIEKIILFCIASLLTFKVAIANEFDQKLNKEVDLKKIEQEVKSKDIIDGLLDETATQKADKSRTNFNFDNMLIDGTTKAPTGFLITGKKNQALQRMIKLRKDFKEELKKSVDQLPALVK